MTMMGAYSHRVPSEHGALRAHVRVAKTYEDRYIGSYAVSQVLAGHQGCVNSIEFSDDGALLLTGSDDRSVCIFGSEDGPSGFGRRAKIPLRHDANIFHAIFLPRYPGTILSCALDGRTVITDVQTEEPTSFVPYGDGRTLASKIACHPAWTSTAFVGYGDGRVVWIDTRTHAAISSWNPHRTCVEEINALAVHANHPFLLCVGTNTHLAYFMDVRKIPAPASTDMSGRGRLATGFIRVPGVREGSCEGIGGLAFSSRGGHLCVNYKSNDVFSVPWQRALINDPQQDGGTLRDMGIVTCHGRRNDRTMFKEAIYFDSDAYVVSGGDCGNLYFWRASDGKLQHRTKGDGDIVNGVLAHDSRPYLVCCGIDNTTKVLRSNGDVLHHAASAPKQLFGTRHLPRRSAMEEPPEDTEFASDASASDADTTSEAESVSERTDESVIAQCEAQNLAMWLGGSESPEGKQEQLRVACMALSRHMNYFVSGSEVPLIVLKRMVAISQAVRHMHEAEDSGRVVMFTSEDDGEDDDEESMDEGDSDDSILHAGEHLSESEPNDHNSEAQPLLQGQSSDAGGANDSHDNEEEEQDDALQSDSDASGADTDDDVDVDDMSDSDSEHSPSGIVSLAITICNRLLHVLDTMLRDALDDEGALMFTLHWWSSKWGGAQRCEVLPLVARKAKLLLLVLEALMVDKGPAVASMGTPEELALWRKMVCRVLLRRIYMEMAAANRDVALQLVEHCEVHRRYEGLVGLGPWPSHRRGSPSERRVRVVALAMRVRILKLSEASDASEALQSAVQTLRGILPQCSKTSPIVRRVRNMMTRLDL